MSFRPDSTIARLCSRGVRIGASAAVVGSVLLGIGGTAPVARAQTTMPASCTAPAVTSTSGTSFTAAETLCRYFQDQGAVVDQRNFSVTVSDTQDLRNRQVVDVSWTGAHPTGGLISDQQGATAATQEYPVVLMECRGTPDDVTPSTCWTATADERTAISDSSTPLWSLDLLNTPAQRAQNVIPLPYPQSCAAEGFGYQYWVPFVAANGTNYPVGPAGCDGKPPEMSNLSGSQQDLSLVPSDTTYAATAFNGIGTDEFSIETNETNVSLGCSDTVACSLVVIPIEGISCSSNVTLGVSANDQCESMGSYVPGSYDFGDQQPSIAVTGSYWWSGSNWQRRIAVPLTFAPPSDICSIQNTSPPVYLYGSELMAQATQQWNPYFCLNPKLFNVEHVQTAEPEAKNLLQAGGIEAAIQGAPPPTDGFFTTPTVQAPVAVSGFAVAYVIDDGNGQPYTDLRLDPRLLAKLLTESYPGTANVETGDVGISRNPLTIFDDPEFRALNPDFTLPANLTVPAGPAATLFSIFTQSDVIWSLTSYINSDPEARAWLNGQPDPWGMVVNPAYKDIQLPVNSWSLLDQSVSGPDYAQGTGNPCLVPVTTSTTSVASASNGVNVNTFTGNGVLDVASTTGFNSEGTLEVSNSGGTAVLTYKDRTASSFTGVTWQSSSNLGPSDAGTLSTGAAVDQDAPRTPDRPLLDNPEATLAQVGYNLQFGIAVSENSCTVVSNVDDWSEVGPETIGGRFLMGIVSLPEAEEYGLPTAALQSYVSPSAPSDFASPVDRIFTAPTQASLQAAAALLTPDPDLGTWVMPYGDFPSDPAAVDAYPGTMLMSVDVPTQGLPEPDSTDYGEYLSFADSTGQIPGVGVAQLPAGYLPVTAANGLANEIAYTRAAAADVTAQNGQVPTLTPQSPSSSGTGGGKGSTRTGTVSPSSGGSGTGPSAASGTGSSGTSGGTTSSTTDASGTARAASGAANGPNGSAPGGKANPSVVEPAAQLGRTLGVTGGIGTLALPIAGLVALVCGGFILSRRLLRRYHPGQLLSRIHLGGLLSRFLPTR